MKKLRDLCTKPKVWKKPSKLARLKFHDPVEDPVEDLDVCVNGPSDSLDTSDTDEEDFYEVEEDAPFCSSPCKVNTLKQPVSSPLQVMGTKSCATDPMPLPSRERAGQRRFVLAKVPSWGGKKRQLKKHPN